jgi:DNA polymerase kappa
LWWQVSIVAAITIDVTWNLCGILEFRSDRSSSIMQAQYLQVECPGTSAIAATASALVIAAADKAGMDRNDRERIAAIILRESGDSLYMQQQRKRDENVNQRIASLQRQVRQQDSMDQQCFSTKPRLPTHHSWRSRIQQQLDQHSIPKLQRENAVTRSTSCVVDMDMFYMACELLSRPDLRDVPACVGQGMILTSNYEARKYGVRSALPTYIGETLVRELSNGTLSLSTVPSHFELYREKGQLVRQILSQYDPHFLRAYSLDEAYMELGPYVALRLLLSQANVMPEDVHRIVANALCSIQPLRAEESESTHPLQNPSESPSKRELSKPILPSSEHRFFDLPSVSDLLQWSMDILLRFPANHCQEMIMIVVQEMRTQVQSGTGGLTCSAGVGPNFMLAKMASDRNKPNGQLVLDSSSESIRLFLHPLAVRKIPGIGRVTEKILAAFNMFTVQDLYEQRALVHFLFKPATAAFLLRACLGLSSHASSYFTAEGDEENDNETPSSQNQKGISRERTFSSGRSWTEINSKLEDISRLLATDMLTKQFRARTITVKVKLHTFDCLSKSRTLGRGEYLQAADGLSKHALTLLREIRQDFKGNFNLRLLGVRCSNFVEDADIQEQSIKRIDNYFATKVASSEGQKHAVQYVEVVPLDGTNEDGSISSACNLESKRARSFVICPICDHSLEGLSNDNINFHIDVCLGSTTDPRIQLLDGTTNEVKTQPKRAKQRLSDYFQIQTQ